MAEENADASPRQASPASFPGVAEIIESVEMLRKQVTDGLKDISEKLDAQDKRIRAVKAFVKNAQSIPDMDDEWRGNDVGYDFSFDRAGKDQRADTTGKRAGDTTGKRAGDTAGKRADTASKGAEEEAGSVAKEAEEEAETVGKEAEAGKGAEASNKEAEPSVMEIELEGETDEVGCEEIERTSSVVVKRGNQKLKILSSKKKRI
ncbi:unnamed protein product [Arabis nemorensis]|uniref:Uncharacterized protein n=1 Tax=Arabis nemorensis TaxID=586526 RepID=A0A565BDI4_9BRAS|nr:unnamed protein product [Arabis nemorensis]